MIAILLDYFLIGNISVSAGDKIGNFVLENILENIFNICIKFKKINFFPTLLFTPSSTFSYSQITFSRVGFFIEDFVTFNAYLKGAFQTYE